MNIPFNKGEMIRRVIMTSESQPVIKPKRVMRDAGKDSKQKRKVMNQPG